MTIEGASVGRIALIVNPDNAVDEGGKLSNNASESNPVTLRLLGTDGTSTVPTAAAVTTTPAPLGKPKTAGTLQTAANKKAPLTGPGGRSVPLHRHIVPTTHSGTFSQIVHNLTVFPKETRTCSTACSSSNTPPRSNPGSRNEPGTRRRRPACNRQNPWGFWQFAQLSATTQKNLRQNPN